MKPGVFNQMYVQLVFAVQNRENLLRKDLRPRIFEYMSGIITSLKQKPIIVNGVQDHVHILVGLNPNEKLSDLVAHIKRDSTKFINSKSLFNGKFQWQDGYGAFSCNRSQLNKVYNYILNQEEHHRVKSFREEYIEFLKEYGIKYDEKFLFDDLRD